MSDHNDAHLSDAVTKEFTAAGYKDDHIAIILARQESLKHERTRDQGETWVKIHRGQILPETLDAYQLPWEWDKVSGCLSAIWDFADYTARTIPTSSSSSVGFRRTYRRNCLRILGVWGSNDSADYKLASLTTRGLEKGRKIGRDMMRYLGILGNEHSRRDVIPMWKGSSTYLQYLLNNFSSHSKWFSDSSLISAFDIIMRFQVSF